MMSVLWTNLAYTYSTSHHIQELWIGEVVVLQEEKDLTVLSGGCLHRGLQLALELFGAKIFAHLE